MAAIGLALSLVFSVITVATDGVGVASATTVATLMPGQMLTSGQSLVAGNYKAIMQTDGNFVVYNEGTSPATALWSSGTESTNPIGNEVKLLSDGDLRIYGLESGSEVQVWYAGTQGTDDSYGLQLFSTGGFGIYGINGVTWDKGTGRVLSNTGLTGEAEQASELWGGGSSIETCASCGPTSVLSKSGGASVNGAQPVGTVMGDFTTSDDLFDIPAVDGQLSLDLTYDSAYASNEYSQSIPPTDFGYGWTSTLTSSITVGGSGDVSLNDANTAQAEFTQDTGGGTCPEADDSSWYKYTIMPGSNFGYCAARKVDAQLAHSTAYGYYQINASGGKATSIYTAYGQLAYQGNIANGGAITWNTDVAPGSGPCPSSWGGTCWTATDTNGRSMWLEEAYGLFVQATDPMGRVYTFGYDTSGSNINLTSITMPAPASSGTAVTNFKYSDLASPNAAELIQITDPAGRERSIAYGSTGMVSLLSDGISAPFTNTTQYSYTNTGCNATSTETCSSGAQKTTVTYPDGEKDVDSYQDSELTSDTYGSATTYNAWSFLQVSANDPQNANVYWDIYGPPYQGGTQGLEAIITTDYSNDMVQYRDPNGNVTTAAYNDEFSSSAGYNLHELCWVNPAGSGATGPTVIPGSCPTGKTPGIRSYTYDTNGDELTAVDARGNTTTRAFTSADQLASVTRPGTGGSQYTYNADGDLTEVSSTGYNGVAAITTNGYNTDGELTCSLSPDGQSVDSGTCSTANPYAMTRSYFPDGTLSSETSPEKLDGPRHDDELRLLHRRLGGNHRLPGQ